jgi:hypothetical protein
MRVDLVQYVTRVLRHRFLFTVKHWDDYEASPCATGPYSVAYVSSFLILADSKLLRDDDQRLHDDKNTATLFVSRRSKKWISTANIHYMFIGTKLS